VGEVRIRAGALRELVPVTFPYRTGFEAAGVVDEVGSGVEGVAAGDEVFGWADQTLRGANAELAVLVAWAPRPKSWSWAEAAGAGAVETAYRVLDRLGVAAGDTVLVQGAAGGTGSVVVQVAAARGAAVIGTARVENHAFLRSLGATPTTYGDGLVERVRSLEPVGVDAVVDCAGASLPDLVRIAGGPERVVTIADLDARRHGVHLSSGRSDPLAVHALAEALALANEGRLRIPVAATFPLAEAAAAHDLAETRHTPGKVVLLG
jgi:NADPH:quinone reductase-like Zn-dependent oxidoreductase